MSTPEQNLVPQQPQPALMDEGEFAARIKRKHPEYEGMDDADLTRRVLDKYPEYHDSVRLSSSGEGSFWHPLSGKQSVERSFESKPSPSTQGQDFWHPVSSAQPEQMDETQFAAKIRTKHPEVYDSLNDAELTRRVLNKYPEYHSYVRLSDGALRPSVSSSVNEEADFTKELPAGIEGFKPIDFHPFKASDLSLPARSAAGFARLGGADLAELPASSPNRTGKIVRAVVRTENGRMPTADELSDALLSSLGASAVGQRYRAETGRNLAVPAIDLEELKRGYDPQTQTYTFAVTPAASDIRIINAYGRGGIKAAEDEIALMNREIEAANESRARDHEKAREMVRRLGFNPDELSSGNPVMKGIADAGMGVDRLMNNVAGLWRDPEDSTRDASMIDDAASMIPPEKTGVGKFVRGVTGVAAAAPEYIAAGPAAPLIAYTENLHRGQESAINEGLKIAAAGGVAHGSGIAVENLSPAARQVIARHMAGMTNVGLDKLSGSERSVVESYLQGALLPVGKGKRGAKEEGPTFDYVHDTLGNLKRSPDQTGLKEGFVRVFDAEGNEFVARQPNPEGVGGVRNKDGSLPALRPGEKFLDVVNVPRAVETAYDLSAIGRQGLILSVLHPVKAAKNFAQSVPTLFSEAAADRILNDIHSSPFAPLRRESGLYLSDYHHSSASLTKGEEGFQSSIAQSIPGVRASERAYVTFLDKMRADVFDGYAETHPDATPQTLKDIAATINDFTGRASLGKWGEKHAQVLNQAFFSPRFQLSRISSLTRPFRGTPEARAYAAKELVKFVSAGIGFMGLARAAGLQVSINPLSPSFGKIRVGNTYVDLWGGFQPLARYTAQIMAGQATSADGETRPRSRLKTALNFLRTKAAPQVAVPLDTLLGADVSGKPATLSNLPKRAMMPMSWHDVEDAVREDLRQGGSGLKGAAVGSLSLFGAGVNTFESGLGASPNLVDERRRLRIPESQSPAIEKALDGIVTSSSYPALHDDKMRRHALFAALKGAREDEQSGLSEEAIQHNARVNAQAAALRHLVEADESLTLGQREQLNHWIASKFFYARMKPDDRRELSSVQRVFSEKAKNSASDLMKRIEALKK